MSPDLADVAGRFGHLLHEAGVPVTPERLGRFAAALRLARPATVDELYWTARVTLVADAGELVAFDRVFARVFEGLVDVAEARGPHPPPAATRRTRPGSTRGGSPAEAAESPDGGVAQPGRPEGAPTPRGGERDAVLAATSSEERLRTTDFAALSEDELLRARRLLDELSLAPPDRRVRRAKVDDRGRRIDLRRTLARARRTGGDPVVRVRRRPRRRPRRLVLLCDISGSMEPYARAYLQLLHAGVRGARAEAFVFATRLTRITRALAVVTPDVALGRAGATAPDWSGGTRIGRALKAFNDQYGRRGLARGAVVVIVSDGWERDDPALLGREMQRLGRLAHRIVWINPRRAVPDYRPLVGGMSAALPHVDAFVSGHSVEAMQDVVEAIADRGP